MSLERIAMAGDSAERPKAGYEMYRFLTSERYPDLRLDKRTTVHGYTIVEVTGVEDFKTNPDRNLTIGECLLKVRVVPEDATDTQPQPAELRFDIRSSKKFTPTLELAQPQAE